MPSSVARQGYFAKRYSLPNVSEDFTKSAPHLQQLAFK